MYKREEVEKANIELSKVLADKYNETEPHYKEENRNIVKAKLEGLRRRTSSEEKLLDMGCGTGFIIDLAKNWFRDICGVDISQDMLDKVDIKHKTGSIRLFKESTESTKFIYENFDVVTAYSLLHHLHNIEPTLKEAYRVLKPGGIFWSALDPNFYFFQALKDLPQENINSEKIKRELREIDNKRADSLFREAEPLKYIENGLIEEDLHITLSNVGFKNINIEYYWFLGERYYIEEPELRDHIDIYLASILPLSRNLFKYISITGVK